MLATLVFVDVKPEFVEAFKAISVYNHDNSRKEPGNVRFDVLQSNDDPTKFMLYEVYATPEDAAAFLCENLRAERTAMSVIRPESG